MAIKLDAYAIRNSDLLLKHNLLVEQTTNALQALSLLAEILTVDGAGSLLDADLLDGYDSSFFAVGGALPTIHNILSASHGDTLVDVIIRGDILYGNATPKMARLAFPGTPTGKVLQATATDVEWSANPIAIGSSASVSGANSGDNAVNTLYSGLVTNATHTGDVAGATELTIGANKVTLAMMAKIATDTFLANITEALAVPTAVSVAEQTIVGRITGGHIDDLSATQVRTLLNVADGANAGATKALDNLVGVAINTSLISDEDNTDDLGSLLKAWKNIFGEKIYTPVIAPHADGATAIQIMKADGTTPIVTVDSTNSRIGIGVVTPTAVLHLKAGTATAGTAPVRFTSGPLLTVPEPGVMEYYNDRIYITNVGAQRPIDRSNGVIVASTTVTSTVETLIYTASIPVNALKAGNHIKIWTSGQFITHDANDQCTIRVKIGGVTKATVISPKVADGNWHMDTRLTVRTAGASGTLSVHVDLDASTAATNIDIPTEALNTESANDLTITAQWNDVDNSIQINQGITEFKN